MKEEEMEVSEFKELLIKHPELRAQLLELLKGEAYDRTREAV